MVNFVVFRDFGLEFFTKAKPLRPRPRTNITDNKYHCNDSLLHGHVRFVVGYVTYFSVFCYYFTRAFVAVVFSFLQLSAVEFRDWKRVDGNNNSKDNVYGSVIMPAPLREFIRFTG